MKIGVFTVMLPDLTPEAAATALHDTGYDGIEWRVTHTAEARRNEQPSFWGNNYCTLAPTLDEAQRARALADAAGLEIPSLGTYIDVGDLAATEAAMQFAQQAGVSQLRVGAGRYNGVDYAGHFEKARRYLDEVARLAERYQVKALIEMHHGTICPSASLARRLVSPFDPQRIGVIYDIGNMVFEGYEDERLGVQLLGPYLAHVHIKNAAFDRPADGGVWTARWSPLEDGVASLPRLIAALREVGYDSWLVIEDFSAVRPTLEALRHNLAFVRDALEA